MAKQQHSVELIRNRDNLRFAIENHLKRVGYGSVRMSITPFDSLVAVLAGNTDLQVEFEWLVKAYREQEVTL